MLSKKILLGSVASAFVILASMSSAKAEAPCGLRPYVALRGAMSMIKNHVDKNVWEASGAVGMQMNTFRTELEYSYRGKIKGDYLGIKYKNEAQNLMVNGYYDFKTDMALYPYLNLGIGASRLKIKNEDGYDKTSYRFAWGGGAGLGYDLTNNLSLDIGYRFLDLGKEIKANEFYGGVRFAF